MNSLRLFAGQQFGISASRPTLRTPHRSPGFAYDGKIDVNAIKTPEGIIGAMQKAVGAEKTAEIFAKERDHRHLARQRTRRPGHGVPRGREVDHCRGSEKCPAVPADLKSRKFVVLRHFVFDFRRSFLTLLQ
jgi:hypothetical protein